MLQAIYVMTGHRTNLVKIGHSRCVAQRRIGIQMEYQRPVKVRALWLLAGASAVQARDIESAIHSHFGRKRRPGFGVEWHYASIARITAAVESIAASARISTVRVLTKDAVRAASQLQSALVRRKNGR